MQEQIFFKGKQNKAKRTKQTKTLHIQQYKVHNGNMLIKNTRWTKTKKQTWPIIIKGENTREAQRWQKMNEGKEEIRTK